MTTSRPILRNATAAVCAATFALALTACGSSESAPDTVRTKPAPALTKVDAPKAPPHDFSHEPRCFPARACR